MTAVRVQEQPKNVEKLKWLIRKGKCFFFVQHRQLRSFLPLNFCTFFRRTEFTVEMIAEYDWPPPKGCCPARNRDTYMIQEQVAEYLGVKSFKRKYQELPRRMVEMEERNYLMEKGLVSEKMCDLGLTAVLASDVLDIMHNDFYDKYEEYKRFLREKHIRDLAAKQKAMQAEAVEKNLSAREHAIRAASLWNINFNKS